MPRTTAGLVMCRHSEAGRELLLVHPGGPYFRRKDLGSWSIPKGFSEDGDADLLAAAKREFAEETGLTPVADHFESLASIKQKGGKVVHAWAFEGDWDPADLASNVFELEWPPRSGKMQSFPEVDRAEWFDEATARTKVIEAQWPLLERALAWFNGKSRL